MHSHGKLPIGDHGALFSQSRRGRQAWQQGQLSSFSHLPSFLGFGFGLKERHDMSACAGAFCLRYTLSQRIGDRCTDCCSPRTGASSSAGAGCSHSSRGRAFMRSFIHTDASEKAALRGKCMQLWAPYATAKDKASESADRSPSNATALQRQGAAGIMHAPLGCVAAAWQQRKELERTRSVATGSANLSCNWKTDVRSRVK